MAGTRFRVPGGSDAGVDLAGRIRTGADADLVVFDPPTVADRATYQRPAEPSVGMKYVLVGGVPLVRDGQCDPAALLGRPVRAAVR